VWLYVSWITFRRLHFSRRNAGDREVCYRAKRLLSGVLRQRLLYLLAKRTFLRVDEYTSWKPQRACHAAHVSAGPGLDAVRGSDLGGSRFT
jgi:hypothetical protein